MDAAREMVNSHRRMGHKCVHPCDFSGRGKWGRGDRLLCSWVHCNVTQCQTKISAQSPEKNKRFGWPLDWLINVLQGLHSATRLLIIPILQTHHLQYSCTASCSRASRQQLEGHFHRVALHSMDSMDVFSAIPLLHRVSVCLWSDTIMLLLHQQETKAF